jgi:hypothetical protein
MTNLAGNATRKTPAQVHHEILIEDGETPLPGQCRLCSDWYDEKREAHMKITEKLDALARECGLTGDDKARLMARRFAHWAVRELASQASIVDYEREEFEKRVEWLVGEVDKA